MKVWVLLEESLIDNHDTDILGIFDNVKDAEAAFVNVLHEFEFSEDDANMDSLRYNDGEEKIWVTRVICNTLSRHG